MICPKCQKSEVWDNGPSKAAGKIKPNAPDLACKDKEGCGWKQWPEKKASPKGDAPAKAASPRAEKWTWGTLALTYRRCLYFAEKAIIESSKRTKIGFTTADLCAATATLFIAASRDGIRAEAPKDQPLDQKPGAIEDAEADDDLPF